MVETSEHGSTARKEQLESLQAIIDRLTVENVRLKTSDLERRKELMALQKQYKSQAPGDEEGSGEPETKWYQTRAYHVSVGLCAFAATGAVHVTSIAFPHLQLLAEPAVHYLIGAFGTLGLLGLGSGLIEEWDARRKKESAD